MTTQTAHLDNFFNRLDAFAHPTGFHLPRAERSYNGILQCTKLELVPAETTLVA